MAAAATAPARAPVRKSPARRVRASSAPARHTANATAAPARTAPARKPARRKAPSRRPGGQLIPIAVGTATAVRQLPDSSLMVRLTRGRAWIAVLGLLLAGIVVINVLTLSVAATAGHVDRNIQALDAENSLLRSRDAQRSGAARVRHDAAALGLTMASSDQVAYVQFEPRDIDVAAQRLAASAGY